MFNSLFKFRGTNIAKAFLINAVIVGIISALTIEIRRILDDEEFKEFLPNRIHKVTVTMIISIFVGMTAFIAMRLLFGTYAGVLDGKQLHYFLVE